jgi:hypothetical protein
MFRGWEEENGYLGVDYTDGADTRWDGRVVCGPLLTTTTLTTSPTGTTANTNAFAVVKDTGGTDTLYVARGTKTAKRNCSDLTNRDENSAALAERVTGLHVTQLTSGTPQLTQFMAGTAYRVTTTIATGDTDDTHVANSGSEVLRIGFDGEQRVVGALNQSLRSNVLDSGVSMSSPNWTPLARYNDIPITPTGGCMVNGTLILGHDRGASAITASDGRLTNLIPILPADTENGRATRFNPWFGALVPTKNGLYAIYDGYSQRIGPEAFSRNESIQGYFTGSESDGNYQYMTYRDEINSLTYLFALRPVQPDDHMPPGPSAAWFCIASFSDVSEAVFNMGLAGGRTNPLLLLGKGSDMYSIVMGRSPRWIADGNYLYQTNTDQSVYLTEWRLKRAIRVSRFHFRTANCSTGRTVTVKLRYVTKMGQTETKTLAVINGNGFHSIRASEIFQGEAVFMAVKPIFTLRTDVNTSSPVVIGDLEMDFEYA